MSPPLLSLAQARGTDKPVTVVSPWCGGTRGIMGRIKGIGPNPENAPSQCTLSFLTVPCQTPPHTHTPVTPVLKACLGGGCEGRLDSMMLANIYGLLRYRDSLAPELKAWALVISWSTPWDCSRLGFLGWVSLIELYCIASIKGSGRISKEQMCIQNDLNICLAELSGLSFFSTGGGRV